MSEQTSDERIVRELDQRWNDVYVKNDRAPFAEILADDLRVTWPDGRSELAKVKMMEPTPGERRVEFSERSFEIYESTAVTRGRIRVEHPEGPMEQRFVRVYAKRADRWQAVSVHVFPLDMVT
jgi:ketosteroid isomerase-like protein